MPSRLVIYVEEEAERFEMPGMVFDSSEIASSRQNRTDTYMNSQTARAHVKSAQFKPEQNPSTKSGSGHEVPPLTMRCLQLLPAVKGGDHFLQWSIRVAGCVRHIPGKDSYPVVVGQCEVEPMLLF